MAEGDEIPEWRRRLHALRQEQGSLSTMRDRRPRPSLRILDDDAISLLALPSATSPSENIHSGNDRRWRSPARNSPARLKAGRSRRLSGRGRLAARGAAALIGAAAVTTAVLTYGQSLDSERRATAAATAPLRTDEVKPLFGDTSAVDRSAVDRSAGAATVTPAMVSATPTLNRATILVVLRVPHVDDVIVARDRLHLMLGEERVLADIAVGQPGDGVRGVMVLDAHDLFRPGSAEITFDGRLDLVAVASMLRSYPGATVDIVGHTDAIGDPEVNDDLSQRWADSVAALIDSETGGTVTAHPSGRGAAEPLSDNETATGRRRNNRIEIVFRDPIREELSSRGPR
jgi:outer membrane protein OmpA-like peptidoglycan-associated protein